MESLKSKFPTVPEGRMGVMSDRLMIPVEWSGGGEVGFGVPALERLMHADAWQSIWLGRREALWQIRALGAEPLPLFAAADARAQSGDNRGPVERGTNPTWTCPAMWLLQQHLEQPPGDEAPDRWEDFPPWSRAALAGLLTALRQPRLDLSPADQETIWMVVTADIYLPPGLEAALPRLQEVPREVMVMKLIAIAQAGNNTYGAGVPIRRS
ncbi:hypothetical protein [Azospirillum thiophilum]|nr:hypothetical protein [Azospirillum thiophilum]